jgi:uncharacterized NAD-dependent epimerase/dehydratase family protein
VLVIGIALLGGVLPEDWHQDIRQAIVAGLSIVNGLHTPLNRDPVLQALLKPGQWIWDVRQEPAGLTVATGQARSLSCLRVLTVGTDMSVGKMSTSLELHHASLQRGYDRTFSPLGRRG